MKRIFLLMMICFLLAGCAGKQTVQEREKEILVMEKAYTLSDGTVIDQWQGEIFEEMIYKTSEGWELLRIGTPVDIANVSVAGEENFRNLNETAQQEIRAYYDANWPELDVQMILENAWSDMNSGDPKEGMFSPHQVFQNIYHGAYNESIMCFTVETIDNAGRVDYFSTVFDRRTGAVVDLWDLFAVEKSVAEKAVAEALARNDAQYEELLRGMDSANVMLQQGGLIVIYPAGTLSWLEYDCHMYLDCEDLDGFWQDWAITHRNS